VRRLLVRRCVLIVLGALVAVLALAGAATAQEVKLGGKVRSGRQVVIPQNETVPGDLIVAGGRVSVDGTVNGDLVATGGSVEVRGKVLGEALLAGGQISVPGEIDGALRVGAGQVTLGGIVKKDVLLGAGRAVVTSSGRIGGDFIFSAGQMTLDGAVAGRVLGYAGSYTKNGTVAGTEEVTLGQTQKHVPTAGDRVLGFIREYVSILALGALFLWLLPKLFLGTEWGVRGRVLPSLGVGIGGVFGLAVLLLFLIFLAAALGIPLGLLGFGSLVAAIVMAVVLAWMVLGFLLFVLAAFGAPAVVGTAVGDLILGPRSEPATKRPFVSLALGVLIVVALMTVPVVGGLFGVLVFLLGLGALLLWLWQRRRGPETA
jgi:hypothetical protein